MVNEIVLVSQLLFSVVLGAIVGFEREESRKPAGLRTHILVCLGSCLATVVSVGFFDTDPARIAAGIVTGIGFLGAGSIIASRGHIKGLTTAASLWTVAIIGMAAGTGAYVLAFATAVLVFVILQVGKVERMVEQEIIEHHHHHYYHHNEDYYKEKRRDNKNKEKK
jgi:putative Mg2+ transporter-C (MgtC) family protein